MKKISKQDIRLLSYCIEKNKPIIIVANKWDLIKNTSSKIDIRKTINQSLPFYLNIPIIFTNALSGLGIPSLVKKIQEIKEKSELQILTSKLNRFLIDTLKRTPPPIYGTKTIKLNYMTQTKINPPQFLIFSNEPKGIPFSYKKFLIKSIQRKWDLKGIPVKISFRKKRK